MIFLLFTSMILAPGGVQGESAVPFALQSNDPSQFSDGFLQERGIGQPSGQCREFSPKRLAIQALLMERSGSALGYCGQTELGQRLLALQSGRWTPHFDIPMRVNEPAVQKYIAYFSSGGGRAYFQGALERFDQYAPLMRGLLRKQGVPEDTVYVAFVESGMKSSAYSKAKAVGFWQFIASTGRMYRLRQNRWVDDRRDFVASTQAAAAFLTDLYRTFGDWHLAWAGYNAGGGRVGRALQKQGVHSFWELRAQKALPEETRNYVPKIIAAAWIEKNRRRYGFRYSPPKRDFDFVTIDSTRSKSLAKLAKSIDVDVASLEFLNPHLRRRRTPPFRFQLRVPVSKQAVARTWMGRKEVSKTLDPAWEQKRIRVRAGETLSAIARRYRTSVDVLVSLNMLEDAHHLRIGQLLKVPNRVGDSKRSASKSYTVQAGDTFWSIAASHGLSVSELMQRNDRTSTFLQVGERLQIGPTPVN